MMDRVFENKLEDGTVQRTTDRVYFKMKSDRTMKIYKQENRPKFEMFKREQDGEEGGSGKKKKRLFEKGDESLSTVEESWKKKDIEASFFDVDGTWWWYVLGFIADYRRLVSKHYWRVTLQ